MPSPASGIRDIASKQRVLVVDDDLDSAELLGVLLERAGYDHRIARDSAAALAAALALVPHVALIDIGRPGMDGCQLLSAMRAEPVLANCRFVAVTGYSVEDLESRGDAAGFHAHLRKPIDFDAVYRVLGEQTQIAFDDTAAG